MLDPQDFIIANSALVAAMVASLYLLRFRRKKPTRLDLKAPSGPIAVPVQAEPILPPTAAEANAKGPHRQDLHFGAGSNYRTARTYGPEFTQQAEKKWQAEQTQLTIMFNYNGHLWEAYESLGIPAGSSLESARLAHTQIVSRCDTESRLLYDMALEAIIIARSKAS